MIIRLRQSQLTHYGVPGMRWGQRLRNRLAANYADKFRRRAERLTYAIEKYNHRYEKRGMTTPQTNRLTRLNNRLKLNTIRTNYYSQGLSNRDADMARKRFYRGQGYRYGSMDSTVRYGRATLPARFIAGRQAKRLSGGLRRPNMRNMNNSVYNRFNTRVVRQ